MTFEPPESRIIATRNRNQNMVFAMLHRVSDRDEPFFADGFRRFGVALLVGVNDRVKLLADALPYEMLPRCSGNDNVRR